MKIKVLTDQQKPAWNAAVDELPEATFFHRAEWRSVIANSYRFPAHYLYAQDDNGICGLLPLYKVSTPLLGSSLMSVPIGVYGGAVAHSESIAQLLEDHAVQLAQQLGVGHLLLRNRQRQRDLWPVNSSYVTFQRALPENSQDILASIPQKQRAEVRKGQQADLTLHIDQQADTFYRLYARSMRDLGTPVYPKQLFRQLLTAFPQHCDIFTVSKDGKPLSAVLNFYFKDQVLPYFGAGTPAARQHSAFPYMYWQLMCHAVDRGYRQFDFGRSIQGSGAYAFKKNFGFTAQPLHYQHQLINASSLAGADPDNALHQRLSKLWQQLPLPVANLIGPFLSRVIV